MIIYPYRDAIEGIKEIVEGNLEADRQTQKQLAKACREYLYWLDEDEDEEDEDE